MPKIKRNEHQIELGKDEDVIIKGRRFHVYFKNRYMLISLTNDILTGLFYIFGSIVALTDLPAIYGTIAYLIGAIFLTIRPLFTMNGNKMERKKRISKYPMMVNKQ